MQPFHTYRMAFCMASGIYPKPFTLFAFFLRKCGPRSESHIRWLALEWYEWYGRAFARMRKHWEWTTQVPSVRSIIWHCNSTTKDNMNRAPEWYERALAGMEKALRVDHPGAVRTVHSMAFVILQQRTI